MNDDITVCLSEANEKAAAAITDQTKTVIGYLEEFAEMTDEALQELLNIKRQDPISLPARCTKTV